MTDLSKQGFLLHFSKLEDYANGKSFEDLLGSEIIYDSQLIGINHLMSVLISDSTIINAVYLCKVFDEIFVSDSIIGIVAPLKGMIEEFAKAYEMPDNLDVWFFECHSYEDAYKTALDMQEEKELCYEKK